MFVSGEDIADVVCALEHLPAVRTVNMLPPRLDPEAYSIVVVLSPYSITELVKTHYAVVEATAGRTLAGRILYVDGGKATNVRGRPVKLTDAELGAGRARVAERKKQNELDAVLDREAMESAFHALEGRAANDVAVAVTFGPTPILEIVPDPFPSPRRLRVLVADDDPITAKRIGELSDVDVIEVEDGWSAVDRLSHGDVDLAVCAVKLGDFSGAKIHKLVATANPAMARRIVYLASEVAVSQAPPSSASGRLLARPISPDAVRSLLETFGPAS